MSDPHVELDLARWSAVQARAACFGSPPGDSRWKKPGTALVSRRLCALIDRRRTHDGRARGLEPDLYQHVYEDVWKRFDRIWERFRESGREPRWNAFEAFLQVTIARSLSKAIKRLSGREAPIDKVDLLAGSTGPESILDARLLFEQAFFALPGDARAAIHDLHLLGRSTKETARRLGLDVKAVYKLRHRALRRFRNELITLIGEEMLSLRPDDRSVEALVRERCRADHPCYLFKIECRSAKGAAELATQVGASTPAEVEDALARLADGLTDALAERGIPPTLDACIWERGEAAESTGRRDHE